MRRRFLKWNDTVTRQPLPKNADGTLPLGWHKITCLKRPHRYCDCYCLCHDRLMVRVLEAQNQ